VTDASPPQPGLLSLVVPVFNETDSLAPLVAEIEAVVKTLPEWKYEVIFFVLHTLYLHVVTPKVSRAGSAAPAQSRQGSLPTSARLRSAAPPSASRC